MMPRRTKIIVLDSWAIMAYFQDEPAAEAVQNILVEAHEKNKRLLMSIINVGEIWYNYARRITEAVANERVSQMRMAGVDFIDADWDLTLEASRIKSKHAIAYADCFAAALAKQEKAEIYTGDPEFRAVEEDLQIVWL